MFSRVARDPLSQGNTMIIAYHAILSAYGFWLPNDPRGSWSDFVGAWELLKFGRATKTTERRSLAHDPHDAALRRRAKEALKYPSVRFDPLQRDAIGLGFSNACADANYGVLACCIGHDHAHVVVERHTRDIEMIVGHLKASATRSLTESGVHPLAGHVGKRGGLPTPWSAGCWKVFIDDEAQLHSAIAYVERHPEKEGMKAQSWDFVRR